MPTHYSVWLNICDEVKLTKKDFTVDFKGVVGLKVPWSHLAQDWEHVQKVVQRHVALSVLREHLSDPLAKRIVLQPGHQDNRTLPNAQYSGILFLQTGFEGLSACAAQLIYNVCVPTPFPWHANDGRFIAWLCKWAHIHNWSIFNKCAMRDSLVFFKFKGVG